MIYILYFLLLTSFSCFFHFEDLGKTGAITAKRTYGVQEGWVAHGFTDNRMGCGMLGETRTTDKQTDR